MRTICGTVCSVFRRGRFLAVGGAEEPLFSEAVLNHFDNLFGAARRNPVKFGSLFRSRVGRRNYGGSAHVLLFTLYTRTWQSTTDNPEAEIPLLPQATGSIIRTVFHRLFE